MWLTHVQFSTPISFGGGLKSFEVSGTQTVKNILTQYPKGRTVMNFNFSLYMHSIEEKNLLLLCM